MSRRKQPPYTAERVGGRWVVIEDQTPGRAYFSAAGLMEWEARAVARRLNRLARLTLIIWGEDS